MGFAQALDALWRGEKSYNGVAVLARGAEPVLVRERLPGDRSDRQGRYLETAVDGLIMRVLDVLMAFPLEGQAGGLLCGGRLRRPNYQLLRRQHVHRRAAQLRGREVAPRAS